MTGCPHSFGPVTYVGTYFPVSRCRCMLAELVWTICLFDGSLLNGQIWSCQCSLSFLSLPRLSHSSFFIVSSSFRVGAFLRRLHVWSLSTCLHCDRRNTQTHTVKHSSRSIDSVSGLRFLHEESLNICSQESFGCICFHFPVFFSGDQHFQMGLNLSVY